MTGLQYMYQVMETVSLMLWGDNILCFTRGHSRQNSNQFHFEALGDAAISFK